MATLSCPPVLSLERLVNPTERQREFLRTVAEYDFVLYGGEGGGGKSYILRWWLVLYLIWAFKTLGLRNVVVGLFAVDYPMLRDRQIVKMQKEFPSWLGRLQKRETWNFTLRPEYGGGEIALRNLDDPEKYKSAEFAAIAVEELTEVPLKVFNDLRWRIRWPGIQRRKFAAATNPGGVGHVWVKNYWILKRYPPELEAKRDQFIFVRAKASDNPHLDDTYHDDLLTLPPDMARMVGRGDWNVFTGQMFPQFRNGDWTDEEGMLHPSHVIPQAEAMRRVKPWNPRWISGDWGFEHPACYHWFSKDENNRVLIYDELWDRRVSEDEWGKRVTERECEWRKRWPQHQRLKIFPFSWDAGKQSSRSSKTNPKSIMQLVTKALGPEVPDPFPADSAPGTRISGWRLMSQLLDADMLAISDACPKLIECLPILIRDEENKEDVLKIDYAEGDTIGDDPADSARMGLQNEFGIAVPPVAEVAQRKIAKYAESRGQEVSELDPNALHMMQRRAMADEQRRRNKRRGGLGRIWRPRS